MLTPAELDAPARLHYASPDASASQLGSAGAREFPTLREAIHVAMTEEAPAGCEPYIRTESGTLLQPSALQAIFDSLQGP